MLFSQPVIVWLIGVVVYILGGDIDVSVGGDRAVENRVGCLPGEVCELGISIWLNIAVARFVTRSLSV